MTREPVSILFQKERGVIFIGIGLEAKLLLANSGFFSWHEYFRKFMKWLGILTSLKKGDVPYRRIGIKGLLLYLFTKLMEVKKAFRNVISLGNHKNEDFSTLRKLNFVIY